MEFELLAETSYKFHFPFPDRVLSDLDLEIHKQMDPVTISDLESRCHACSVPDFWLCVVLSAAGQPLWLGLRLVLATVL